MALVFIEGFDSYADARPVGITTGSDVTINTTIPRTGRACLQFDGSAWVRIPFGGNSNEVYVGFAYRHNNLPGLNDYIFVGFGDDDMTFITLGLKTTGAIVVKMGSAEFDPVSEGVLEIDTWYYIEVKVVKANSISAGDVQVWVDGVLWIELAAGEDTLYALGEPWTNILCFYGYAGCERYVDDIYICDETGPINNTFLGPVKVATLYPNGEGNTNQFTGSDADSVDNHLHVDDSNGQDEDTSYVESDTVDHIDLYTLEDTTAEFDAIHGIDVVSVVKNDVLGGGCARTGAPILRINGTNYQGDTFGVGNDYVHKHHLLEVNPDDSAAWEAADIDAIELGIKVVS